MTNYFFALIIAVVLSGCSSSSVDEKEKMQSPQNNRIIFLTDYCSTYLKKAGLDANDSGLYWKEIGNPVFQKYFTQCEYADVTKQWFNYSVTDTTGFYKAIQLVNDSQHLIQAHIIEALKKCHELIPNDSLNIFILPAITSKKELFVKMGGVTGMTAGSKHIILCIDPSVSTWKEVLKYAMAHEYNHAYWTHKKYYKEFNWTLLHDMTFEGKADNFAQAIYPNAPHPWTHALTETQKQELWNKIQPQLHRMLPENSEVMFGSERYPKWGGYTLGYDIVRSALKNSPGLKPAVWVILPTDSLLNMSKKPRKVNSR